MLRVIQEIRPAWVVGENVAGIVNLALDTVLSDLESIGYAAQTLVIPACAVDARHRRDRCFILAHALGKRRRGRSYGNEAGYDGALQVAGPCSSDKQSVLADANSKSMRHDSDNQRKTDREVNKIRDAGVSCRKIIYNADGCGHSGDTWRGKSFESENGRWWPVEPNVGRVANGVPFRVDRLKCLGNAVVPQQVYPIFKAIAEIERGFLCQDF